jgi:SAM-dependent methyltransferase
VSSRLNDPEYVRGQYRDASKLRARVRLYEVFGTNERGLQAWCFDGMQLPRGARVLELGSGTGSLWVENADRVPADSTITLSDLSPGMLEAARERAVRAGLCFEYERIDAQAIPKADAAFDVVIANHMLYHVPDRGRALAEIHRVLVPGGRLYALTNGWSHLIELVDLCERFGLGGVMPPSRCGTDRFDIETAARELEALFGEVRVRSYRDQIEVKDAGPLIDYLCSVHSPDAEERPALQAIREHVSWWIGLHGSFHIGSWVGQLDATK